MTDEKLQDVLQKPFNRLGTCEICRVNLAKYTCPACNLISCSLPCVKKHKTDNDCDGIRPRTIYKKLPDLTKDDILQDCKLLEEVCRTVETSHKETRKVSTKGFIFLSQKFYKLRTELLRRGTRLILLPPSFARHKKNQSFLKTSSNIVYWSLQLTFLNAKKFSVTENKWSEDTPLKDLIEKYLDVGLSITLPDTFKRLNSYREAGLSCIDVLLKADKVPEADKTFYKLDLEKTLAENLIGKTIVEFPQLYIVINNFYRATPINPSKQKKRIIFTSKRKRSQSLLLSESQPQVKDITSTITSNGANSRTTEFLEMDEDNTSDSDSDFEIDGQDCLSAATYKDLISTK